MSLFLYMSAQPSNPYYTCSRIRFKRITYFDFGDFKNLRRAGSTHNSLNVKQTSRLENEDQTYHEEERIKSDDEENFLSPKPNLCRTDTYKEEKRSRNSLVYRCQENLGGVENMLAALWRSAPSTGTEKKQPFSKKYMKTSLSIFYRSISGLKWPKELRNNLILQQ